jgi:hypothetical protein
MKNMKKTIITTVLGMVLFTAYGCGATRGGEDAFVDFTVEQDGLDGVGDTTPDPLADDGSDVILDCVPGTVRCGIDGVRERCSATGTWDNDPCPTDSACIGEGECLARVCERGETRCNPDDPAQVQICDGTMTGWVLSMVCPGESICEYGVCVPRSCEPGSVLCTSDGKMRVCNEAGTGYGDPEDCETGMVCDTDACVPVVCTPGTMECIDLARRRVCNFLGSGWDAEDCVEGTSCTDGECLEQVCDPLSRDCDPADHLAWRQCNASGTAWGASTACPEGQGCSSGVCLTQVCVPGATICAPGGLIRTCSDSGTEWGTPSPCPGGQACDGGTCMPVVCTPGDSTCLDDSTASVCNDTGTRYVDEPCGGGYVCASDACRLQTCLPGLRQCLGPTSIEECDASGTGWATVATCNGAAGEVCFEGACLTLCQQAEMADSSIGCVFYGADLDNYSTTSDPYGTDTSPYAIVVANTHDSLSAAVTVQDRRGGGGTWRTRATYTIGTNSLHTFQLDPDQHAEDTNYLSGYAYRVTSTIPVVAYQFNPIDSADRFTNDASLLLPKHALDQHYFVSSYRHLFNGAEAGYVTVVGTVDGTSVTVTVRAGTSAGGGIPALSSGGTYTRTINEGDVLQLATSAANNDLTGSTVDATQPVAVFGGTECSDVPQSCSWCRDAYGTTPGYPPTPGLVCGWDVDCPAHAANTCAWCDHLEEQMFPLTTWGTSYVAARVPVQSSGAVEAALWRVIASEDSTTVTISVEAGVTARFAPGGGFTTVLNRGQYMEFELAGTSSNPGDAFIQATRPIMVVQYIEGQECTNIDPFAAMGGDPAMILMVPTEQYLAEYIFLTPSTYDVNYVVVVKPTAGTVTLDGAAVGGFINAGGGFQVSRRSVSAGVHHIEGTQPFGIIGVGYSPQVSYGYMGGLALRVINPG